MTLQKMMTDDTFFFKWSSEQHFFGLQKKTPLKMAS